MQDAETYPQLLLFYINRPGRARFFGKLHGFRGISVLIDYFGLHIRADGENILRDRDTSATANTFYFIDCDFRHKKVKIRSTKSEIRNNT